MQIRDNITHYKKAFVLLTGILAALVILTSRSFSHVDLAGHQVLPTQELEERDAIDAGYDDTGTSQDQEERPVLSDANDAIASINLLHIDHTLYFISETIFSEIDLKHYCVEVFQELTTYFKVLFRRIISPNAP